MPRLDHELPSYPWLGETCTTEVTRVPAGNVPVFFATGFAAAANSLGAIGMPGCTQYVAPIVSDLRIASGGRATWSLPIPSNAAGVIASNGLDLRVGSR